MRVEVDGAVMNKEKELLESELPCALYTATQSRAADSAAIHQQGVPSIVLMKRAARAAFKCLQKQWPAAKQLSVFCGAGNNGGDGYILAGLAKSAGMQVIVYALQAPSERNNEVQQARAFAAAHEVCIQAFDDAADLNESDVLVDAMLGTGINKPLKADYAVAVTTINQCDKPVLAIDIPSGLGSDSGHVLGVDAVRAAHTITFITVKQGLLTGRAACHVGELHYADLGVAVNLLPETVRLDLAQQLVKLPPRQADANKGRFGHVLIVGGNHGFAGAALMAASSALRCGAGLVSVATRPQHCAALLAARPELMAQAVERRDDVLPLLGKATVIVIGPGLGQDAWAQQLLQAVSQSGKAVVYDADAINLLARGQLTPCADVEQNVFTPHPGEAARVLGGTAADIQQDRFAALDQLQQILGGVVLLKGAGTLIRDAALPRLLCPYGNPGMASGGMGDVLSGVIAAFMAQGMAAKDATAAAACLHAAAADSLAEESGALGLLATDLLPRMRALLNTAIEVRE